MDERIFRQFELYTHGKEPCIDAIAIITAVLKDLKPNEVRAALVYINDRFRNGYDASREAAGG